MATSHLATSTRQDYQVQAASSMSHLDSTRPARIRRPDRNPFDPMRISYTRAWFQAGVAAAVVGALGLRRFGWPLAAGLGGLGAARSEEHTSELQSLRHLVCRLLLEKKKTAK